MTKLFKNNIKLLVGEHKVSMPLSILDARIALSYILNQLCFILSFVRVVRPGALLSDALGL